MSTLPTSPLILVIEDDEAVRDLERELLEAEGYRVAVHAGPNVRAIFELNPDLVLLDIMSNGKPLGWNLLRELKAAPATARLPVLVVTASPQAADSLRPELDAWGCLLLGKPFDVDVLLAAITVSLRRGGRIGTSISTFNATQPFVSNAAGSSPDGCE